MDIIFTLWFGQTKQRDWWPDKIIHEEEETINIYCLRNSLYCSSPGNQQHPLMKPNSKYMMQVQGNLPLLSTLRSCVQTAVHAAHACLVRLTPNSQLSAASLFQPSTKCIPYLFLQTNAGHKMHTVQIFILPLCNYLTANSNKCTSLSLQFTFITTFSSARAPIGTAHAN